MCPFCSYRSNERLQFGVGRCPGCGTRWPNGEARVLRVLQVMTAIVFTVIGGFCFYFSAVVLKGILRGDEISWWLFAILFVMGGTFVGGGVSAFWRKFW